MRLHGEAQVVVKIGNTYHEINCIIANSLREDLILGYPWLVQQQATFDFARNCIHHGTNKRETIYCLNRKNIPKTVHPELDHTKIAQEFPEEREGELYALLDEFPELWRTSAPPTRTLQHEIRLKTNDIIRSPNYRYSEEKKCIIADQVEEMLANGFIEPSQSPHNSPIVIVSKKDSKPRFCLDFRRLNEATIDEPAVLPLIHETLKDIGPATIFSSLDLKSGYWQIGLSPSARQYTSFTTPDGAAYQFKVMPFGLKTAPMTFQKLMAREVLVGYLHRFCMVYLDDIIVYSETWEQHLNHLRKVFERLQQHGLICAPEKCHFGKRTLEYLGHVVTENGNQPQNQHVLQIQKAPTPTNRKTLRQFLGLCNWLREYVPRYATLAAPLTDLLSTKHKWNWTEEAENAFYQIKQELQKPLVLSRPDPTRTFVLQTDASKEGTAAVLYQERPDGTRDIISYASSRFNPAEQKYHSNEQECLAAVWAIKRYRPYLEGRRFILRTDNRALTWLNTAKDQRAKLTRWALLLQDFTFTLEHCPGRTNELPDALSRNPEGPEVSIEENDHTPLTPPTFQLQEANVDTSPTVCLISHDRVALTEIILQAQERDGETQELREQDTSESNPNPQPPYQIECGLVGFRHDKSLLLYVPRTAREAVLRFFHINEGVHHAAIDMMEEIKQEYFWPNMGEDMMNFCTNCNSCPDSPVVTQVNVNGITLWEEINQEQEKDQEVQKYLQQWHESYATEEITPHLQNIQNQFVVEEGLLYKKTPAGPRIYVPSTVRPQILYQYHDLDSAGHPGIAETTRSIMERFYWPQLRAEVTAYVRQCLLCARCKKGPNQPKAAERPQQPRKPWDLLALDLMGPYPLSVRGKRFILVITDLFTRWTEAFSLTKSTASVLVRVLEEEVFTRYGYPSTLLTDNGRQFISHQWQRACHNWDVKHWTTATYHPRANPTERRNQEIKKGLRLHLQGIDHRQWDKYLPTVLFNLRSRQNTTIKCTPGFAFLGRELDRPGDWRFKLPENFMEAPPHPNQQERAENLEEILRNRHPRVESPAHVNPKFHLNQWVMVKEHPLPDATVGIHAGFQPKWSGPHKIVKQLGKTVYQIQKDKRLVKIHVDQLRPSHNVPETHVEDIEPGGN